MVDPGVAELSTEISDEFDTLGAVAGANSSEEDA